jgi:hypothetical protein
MRGDGYASRPQTKTRSNNGIGRYSAQSIPSYKAVCVHPYKFRYSNADLPIVDGVVTATDLYSILVCATSAVSSAVMFHAVRLRKVELWGSPDPATGLAATCKIEWSNNTVSANGLWSGSGTAVSDTVMGTGKYCHVRANPPEHSTAGFWLNSPSATTIDLFEISLPTNGIMDITIDAVLNYCDPADVGPALVGATTGKIYVRDLAGMNAVDPLNFI